MALGLEVAAPCIDRVPAPAVSCTMGFAGPEIPIAAVMEFHPALMDRADRRHAGAMLGTQPDHPTLEPGRCPIDRQFPLPPLITATLGDSLMERLGSGRQFCQSRNP